MGERRGVDRICPSCRGVLKPDGTCKRCHDGPGDQEAEGRDEAQPQ